MNTLLQQKTYATFEGEKPLRRLPGLCLELLSEQNKTWLDLQKGYESLKNVRERDIPCRGFSVRLQYNPGRIKSSLADVGQKNLNERKCFLCLDHLPEGQIGILYRSEYLILCFTISHIDHRPQAIAEQISTLFQLMADMGSGWAIFYNGPKCGASAPDHLHFQVTPSGRMPIEKEIRDEKRLTLMKQIAGILFYRIEDLGREALLLEGDDLIALGSVFSGFLNELKKAILIDEEPMMNIAGFHEERKWRFVIFPRRKHRPDAFFREGDSRMVVSPGVIDMGGVLITPVEKDFKRLDGATVASIFEEVSLGGKTVERAIDALK